LVYMLMTCHFIWRWSIMNQECIIFVQNMLGCVQQQELNFW